MHRGAIISSLRDRHHFRLGITGLLFLVFFAFIATESQAQNSNLEYTLGTADQVRVLVFDEEDISGEHELNANGYISIPLIGEVKAAGLSERGLAAAIADKLRDGFLINPRVSVQVLNYRPFYIMGEVKKPGGYAYRNGMTVLNAVAVGGGFTYRADEENIIVTRANDPRQKKEKVEIRTKVFPGDVIKVLERTF
jgi:polysaccharide biosynthesis/export protein VpsN